MVKISKVSPQIGCSWKNVEVLNSQKFLYFTISFIKYSNIKYNFIYKRR